MEGGGDSGAGSSRRKRQAERRSSRCHAEAPPAEETVLEIEMEEEDEVPAVDVKTARKALEDAMKTRERLEGMGFGEILRMDRMRPDPALTEALCSKWDSEVTAFIFPWGHMIPSLEDVSQVTGLRVYGCPMSGFTYPGYSELAHRLLVLAEELGAKADLDLHRFLILFLGRLLFATRGDAVHCQFLPLLEELDEVGGYAWGAAFLVHQFDSLSASERQTSTSGFFSFLQVWTYLHLPALRRGILARPDLVPIARRWDPCRDTRTLSDQLASLQEAIDYYPQLDVVWQSYLEEGDEGQPWLVQARPYFGRSVWVHALNLVLPLHLHLCQRSLGLRQSAVEFPSQDRTPRPGRSFRGLHDTTDWWTWLERRHRFGPCCTRKCRTERQPSWRELEQVRRAAVADASSSGVAGSSQSDLEDRLAVAVRRAEETQADLAEREIALRAATDRATELQGQVDSVAGERNQLHIRAEAAEARVTEVTRELVTLQVQGSSVDQEELV
ncbi:hypothetical protein Taro_046003 [Colocasia esculenta]|uniref:Aminotransferase-like plant mobile domain-containing protein n=1 Tax=Colocasia esculenta TaxID=4460 RepID=A0A843WR29_COLES|nr:hypothetical protein [Colocasia esculenta]